MWLVKSIAPATRVKVANQSQAMSWVLIIFCTGEKLRKRSGAERTVVPRARGGQTQQRRRRRMSWLARASPTPSSAERRQADPPNERTRLGSAVGRRRVRSLVSVAARCSRSLRKQATWRQPSKLTVHLTFRRRVSRRPDLRPTAMCAKCAPCDSLRQWIQPRAALHEFRFLTLRNRQRTKCCCCIPQPSWCCFRRFSCKVSNRSLRDISANFNHVGSKPLQF